MTPGILLVIGLAAIVFNSLLLYLIIHLAMRMKRQLWNQKHMLNLLIEISKELKATENFDIENIRLMNNSGSDQFLK